MLDQSILQEIYKRLDTTDKTLWESVLATHSTLQEIKEVLVSMRAELDALTNKYNEFKARIEVVSPKQEVDNAPFSIGE